MEVYQTFARTVGHGRLLQPGDKVLVAYSGGPDSTALVHLLLEMRSELSLGIALAHFNHRLRTGLPLENVDPAVPVRRHLCRVARKVVAVVFVVTGQRATVAVEALRDVDDQVPLVHSAAAVSSRCPGAGFKTPLPSQSSICTRQELAAVPVTFLAIERLGVS